MTNEDRADALATQAAFAELAERINGRNYWVFCGDDPRLGGVVRTTLEGLNGLAPASAREARFYGVTVNVVARPESFPVWVFLMTKAAPRTTFLAFVRVCLAVCGWGKGEISALTATDRDIVGASEDPAILMGVVSAIADKKVFDPGLAAERN